MDYNAEVQQHQGRSAVRYHKRNPIKRHGKSPIDRFTMIPNDLARETELSNYAYRLAIVIRSHADDYEVSVKSLAANLGWCPKRTKQARDELVAARWMAIREYKTAMGTRAFEEYHVDVSRKFTPEEADELNQTVTLAYGSGDTADGPTSPEGHSMDRATRPSSLGSTAAWPWGESPDPHRVNSPIKEYELEDYEEEKLENQAAQPFQPCDATPESRGRSPIIHDIADEYLPDDCSECWYYKKPCGRPNRRSLLRVGAAEEDVPPF
jgi:hypothetical protein